MDNPTREEESGLFGRTPQQRGPLPSILFVMLMLLLFTSHNGEEFLARHQYQEALRKLTYQKSNFTAWMNGDTANFSLVSIYAFVYHRVLNIQSARAECFRPTVARNFPSL